MIFKVIWGYHLRKEYAPKGEHIHSLNSSRFKGVAFSAWKQYFTVDKLVTSPIYIHSPKVTGLLVLEKKIFKGVYHRWAWRSPRSCDQNILYKFRLTYHKMSSHKIWVQLGQWFVRKQCFDIVMGIQYERPWLKGQISTWPLKLIYNHCLIRFYISKKRIMTLA